MINEFGVNKIAVKQVLLLVQDIFFVFRDCCDTKVSNQIPGFRTGNMIHPMSYPIYMDPFMYVGYEIEIKEGCEGQTWKKYKLSYSDVKRKLTIETSN